jgi:hypothetical protein
VRLPTYCKLPRHAVSPRRLVSVLPVPLAARTACWLNAWLAGREPADDVIGGVSAAGAVEFSLETGAPPISAAFLLGELRRLGASRVTAALPIPGHPIGLGGPAAFNQDALEVGEAIVIHGVGIGLVPTRVGSSVRWHGSVATEPAYLPDVGTADRELRDAFRDATERLMTLDVASWNPDIADAVLNLRSPTQLDQHLPFATSRAAQTAITGLRAAAIVALAEREESGPVSAAEIQQRREALRPLDVAARTAVVAACSHIAER